MWPQQRGPKCPSHEQERFFWKAMGRLIMEDCLQLGLGRNHRGKVKTVSHFFSLVGFRGVSVTAAGLG